MRAEAGGKGPAGVCAGGGPAGPPAAGGRRRPEAAGSGAAGTPCGPYACGGQEPAKAGIVIFMVRKSGALRNRRLTDLMVGLVVCNRAEW